MTPRSDEPLYVGYLQPPAPVARRMRRIAALILVLAAASAALAAAGHSRLPASVFEFGTTRTFEGVVVESPAPMLLVSRGAGGLEPSAWLLVAPGKHGAGEIVQGLDGERVRLSGTLIARDGQTMIEVLRDSLTPLGQKSTDRPATVDLGRVTLAGEIVDSKCYLGVMNPGESKSHRDCAVRCISGGAPPLFVAASASGDRMQMLLVSPDGGALHRDVLPYVAEPVEISGQLESSGDLYVLHTTAASIRRLS